MNILEYFSAQIIAVYYETKLAEQTKAPFLFEFYFGNAKQQSIDLSWIKASADEAVLLKVSNWDADPTYRDFGEFQRLDTEMPLYREGVLLKERDRVELLRIANSTVQAGLEELTTKIYNGIVALVEGAAAMREFLRAQLLTTGKISLNSNGVKLDYDYKINAKQKLQTSISWSTKATATPIADLIKFKADAEARTGEQITDFIMNRSTFAQIVEADSTTKLFADYRLGLVAETVLKDRLNTTYGINIIVYDKSYKAKKGDARTYFVPTGKVIAVPHKELGKTMFGQTPEETDLTYSNVANVAIVDTGVAITSIIHPTPVKVETVVSMVCLPTFPGSDLLTIIDVTHTGS